ncbi:MAG: peptidase M22 [Clostridia bacterium]|nr:peptidase M22 [Clostridia bacterium]
MKECFVGIDTSNYTTSVALSDREGRVIANLKRPLPVKAGECGLRQSDAVFAHIKNLPDIMSELKMMLADEYSVLAVGVSATPRDAEGSYMPCFLAGRSAAYSFAAACGAPVFEFSHQSGHIMAAAYSSGAADTLFDGRFLAFHVSGGTTEALLVTPKEEGFSVDIVGGTLDLNAGQLIDRVGVMIGLGFPCGAELEKLAVSYEGEHERIKISVNDGYCNISGVENKARSLYEKSADKPRVAALVFDAIRDNIIEMTAQLHLKYGDMPVLFAGGVMSNRYMREALASRFEAYFSEPAYSADNAAGISLLCRKRFTEDRI